MQQLELVIKHLFQAAGVIWGGRSYELNAFPKGGGNPFTENEHNGDRNPCSW